jgi:hypothetical protein
MIFEETDRRFAPADLPPRTRCPVCGYRGLWAVSSPAFDRFVCPDCRRCWDFEGGLAHRVDATACPGCASRAVCTGAHWRIHRL